MARIYDGYTVDTRLNSADRFIKDHSTNGTKTITASDLAVELAGLVSVVQHRNVYRGKNLGTVITDEQKAAISAGTFDNLFIGDYWTINGTKYEIADMDYFRGVKDDTTASFYTHHLVMVPAVQIAEMSKMNDSDTTAGGYVGSKMYTESLEPVRTKIATDFGDMLITHRDLFSNAVSNGKVTGVIWVDSTVDLMNEMMVCGSMVNSNNQIPVQTTAKSQFALFALNPYKIHLGNKAYWLRDVASETSFADIGGFGTIGGIHMNASYKNHIRPYFLIG